jgi:hypothetical protein
MGNMFDNSVLQPHDVAALNERTRVWQWLGLAAVALMALGVLAAAYGLVWWAAAAFVLNTMVVLSMGYGAYHLEVRLAELRCEMCNVKGEEPEVEVINKNSSARLVELLDHLRAQGIYASYHGEELGWWTKRGMPRTIEKGEDCDA